MEKTSHKQPCFLCLRKNDDGLRQKQIESLIQEFHSIINKKEDNTWTESDKLKLEKNLPTIFRLAHEAPFQNLREGFQNLLDDIEKKLDLKVPANVSQRLMVSLFFSKVVPPVDTKDPLIGQIFESIYLLHGRVSHLDRVLASHPTYLNKYQSFYLLLMTEAGPLPLDWRNYIAIIAASRHNCEYLVRLQEEAFLQNNGDPAWLQGVDHIPKKLQHLLPIIEMLAHLPWLLQKENIAVLTKGADSWSMGELLHAMLVIVTFTSLASVVFGTRIVPEIDIDLATLTSLPHAPTLNEEKCTEAEQTTKQLLNKLKAKAKMAETIIDSQSDSNFDVDDELESPKSKSNSTITSTTSTTATTTTTTTTATTTTTTSTLWDDSPLKKYIGTFTRTHEDYNIKKAYPVYRFSDYSWNEEGFSLLSKFFEDIASPLDEEFQHIFELTYNKFGESEGIDTSPFRLTIWNYVHLIQGIFHDDHDHSSRNFIVPKGTKKLIKILVCYPERLKTEDLLDSTLEVHLEPDEKVHVILLTAAARKQASLLYGLRAITQHSLN